MNDSRIVVENKPYFTVDQSAVCNGHAPEQLQKVMQEANVGICLDMGHAICAANALKEEPLGFIKRFIALAPTMYHLTDGDFHSTIDSHQHFGQGSFPLKEILSLIPSGSVVTNEAVKDSKVNLNDVIEDVSRLKAYLNG